MAPVLIFSTACLLTTPIPPMNSPNIPSYNIPNSPFSESQCYRPTLTIFSLYTTQQNSSLHVMFTCPYPFIEVGLPTFFLPPDGLLTPFNVVSFLLYSVNSTHQKAPTSVPPFTGRPHPLTPSHKVLWVTFLFHTSYSTP